VSRVQGSRHTNRWHEGRGISMAKKKSKKKDKKKGKKKK
jgi:hypothetical protein